MKPKTHILELTSRSATMIHSRFFTKWNRRSKIMLGLRLLYLSKYKVILTCLKKKDTLYVAMKKPNVHSGPMLIKEDGSLWKTRTLIHLLFKSLPTDVLWWILSVFLWHVCTCTLALLPYHTFLKNLKRRSYIVLCEESLYKQVPCA